MGESFVIIVATALFVGSIVGAAGYYWLKGARLEAYIKQFADSFGLKADFSKRYAPMVPLPMAEGEARGRLMRLRTYVFRHARTRTLITQVAVGLRGKYALQLKITKKSLIPPPKSDLQIVETGDVELDRRATLETNAPQQALACLTEDVRVALPACLTRDSGFNLEDGVLIFRETGVLTTRAKLERFERATNVLFDLADAVDDVCRGSSTS